MGAGGGSGEGRTEVEGAEAEVEQLGAGDHEGRAHPQPAAAFVLVPRLPTVGRLEGYRVRGLGVRVGAEVRDGAGVRVRG